MFEKPTPYEMETFKDSIVMENVMRDRAMVTAGLKIDLNRVCWTAEEEKFLIDNYYNFSTAELATKLNKTQQQIYNKTLNLRRKKFIPMKVKKKSTNKPIYGGTLKPFIKPGIKVETLLSEYIVKMNSEKQYTGSLDACKGYRDCLLSLDDDADVEIFQLTEKRIVC